MEFSAWLDLQELFDVQNMDTSQIDFVQRQECLEITRTLGQHGLDRMYIQFCPKTFGVGSHTIDNIWDISFTRNGSFDLLKSDNPFAVYSEVFRAIKALTEQTRVNGFSWSAWDSKTMPTYTKFFQRFLPGFVRVSQYVVVRREVLEQAFSSLSPEERRNVEAMIQNDIHGYQATVSRIAQSRKLGGT